MFNEESHSHSEIDSMSSKPKDIIMNVIESNCTGPVLVFEICEKIIDGMVRTFKNPNWKISVEKTHLT